MAIPAPPAAVFEALSTLDGLARWWTPAVSGDPDVGGELTFGFDDQRVVMSVDEAEPHRRVAWTCTRHTKFPEWDGTSLAFTLTPTGTDDVSTLVAFEHAGLDSHLSCYSDCSAGWAHYLASLASYAGRGQGMPWQSPGWLERQATTAG